MPKKEDFQKELQEKVQAGVKPSHLKKSKSCESLSLKPNSDTAELQAQITALLEQISRLKQETNQSLQTQEQVIKELTTERNKLTDQNNELRINNLKQKESKLTQQLKLQLAKLQKDLTITQQDLKSAQRIIELRTIKPEAKQEENSFDYWTWIRMGSLALLIYLLSQDKEN